MLEIKGLTKVYKPKKGNPVTALKGIDLKFEETGMVFILGKSGSGKSTFLNLVGGLDGYTAGEIIIKGKSSSDFKQKDFDAYRNTYLGFIFQEYNILNEFTVGQNISLALELQGKKNDREAVEKLMKDVDLEGFYARKPFELSGGQKQRVAIARALVKDPEVIMADEPTGALDSATGRQVFETLQKLSKTKLVLIVSHDREYAEFYGDRVIEFKDGKVISDIKKHKTESKLLAGGNISIIDDSIIKIKKGHKLTAEEKKKILTTIESATENDTIISVDKRANSDFMKVSRIDDDGNRESFQDTKDAELNIKTYDAKKFKLKSSKFPNRYAFKMGASGLKGKPIRLIFTVFLCLVSFSLFGLADTMAAYDKYNTTYNSLRSSNVNNFAITRQYAVETEYETTILYDRYYEDENGKGWFDGSSSWLGTVTATMNEADFETLKNKISYTNITPLYAIKYRNFIDNLYGNDSGEHPIADYYKSSFNAFYDKTDQEFLTKHNMELYGGGLPAAADEVLVPKFIADSFVYNNYRNTADGGKITISKPEDLIGKTLKLYANSTSKTVKVVGIINTHFDEERYKSLKPSKEYLTYDVATVLLTQEFGDIINNSYHTALFGGLGFAEYITDNAAPAANENTINCAIVDFAPLSANNGNKLIRFLYDHKNKLDINDFKVDSYYKSVSEIYTMFTPISTIMSQANAMFETMRQIFLWIGVFFAVFASLMLLNFIAVSITYKKHDIGILRAIGAKSSDVYRIFFSESLIIAVITSILSSVAVGFITAAINGWLRSQGFLIELLTFGIRQIAFVFAVALLISALATFLPTFRFAKQKPIDAIKK
jgi:ABC-type lipoprotein export system ATPase subunit